MSSAGTVGKIHDLGSVGGSWETLAPASRDKAMNVYPIRESLAILIRLLSFPWLHSQTFFFSPLYLSPPDTPYHLPLWSARGQKTQGHAFSQTRPCSWGRTAGDLSPRSWTRRLSRSLRSLTSWWQPGRAFWAKSTTSRTWWAGSQSTVPSATARPLFCNVVHHCFAGDGAHGGAEEHARLDPGALEGSETTVAPSEEQTGARAR